MKTTYYPEIQYWARLLKEDVLDMDDFDVRCGFVRKYGDPRRDHGDVLVGVLDRDTTHPLYKILGVFDEGGSDLDSTIQKYSESEYISHLVLFRFDERKGRYRGESVWDRDCAMDSDMLEQAYDCTFS